MTSTLRQRENSPFGAGTEGFDFHYSTTEYSQPYFYEYGDEDEYDRQQPGRRGDKSAKRCCCCTEDDDEQDASKLKKHSGPATGLPVLSRCVPVLGQAYMALSVWVTFYALWTVLGRELSETGPIFKPMLFLFLRNVTSSVVLIGLVFVSQGFQCRSLRPKKRDVCMLVALGLAIWFNQLLYIYGLRFTTATNAALLEACIPVYAMVIGLVIGTQIWGTGWSCVRKVMGLMCCTGGAIFVILGSDRAQGHLNMPHSKRLFGNVLLWMSTVALAVYMHLQAPLSRRYNALEMTAFSQVVCSCFSTLVMLFVGGYMEFDEFKEFGAWVPGPSFWGCLVYAVICISIINFTFETWAIRRSSATTAAVFMTLEPPTTSILSNIILHERLTIQAVIGGVVIISGLLLTLSAGDISHKQEDEDEDEDDEHSKQPLLS